MSELEDFENQKIFQKQINNFLKRKFQCPNCSSDNIILQLYPQMFICKQCNFSVCPVLKPKKEEFKSFEDYSNKVQTFVNDWIYHSSSEAPQWFSVITKQTNKLTEKQKAEWAEVFEKLIRLDKYTEARIGAVILELFKGKFYEFWIEKGNIRTPLKLREKMKSTNWKGVTYFEFFLSQLGIDDSKEEIENKYKPVWMKTNE